MHSKGYPCRISKAGFRRPDREYCHHYYSKRLAVLAYRMWRGEYSLSWFFYEIIYQITYIMFCLSTRTAMEITPSLTTLTRRCHDWIDK